jgi:hypothetical protein
VVVVRLYRIVFETYEPERPFPIVIHVFQGKDRAETEGFVRAHEKSDAFFRECGTKGIFQGTVRCSQRRTFSGWIE